MTKYQDQEIDNQIIDSKSINNLQFNTKLFGGYDEKQVNKALDNIYDYTRNLEEQHEKIVIEHTHLDTKVKDYQEMQETLSTVLVVAQDNADRTIQQAQDQAKETLNLADKDAEAKLNNAKKEADLILADAHQKANQLLSEAHSEKARIESKTQELIAQGEQMRNALKMTAKNQLESLDNAQAWRDFIPNEKHEFKLEE